MTTPNQPIGELIASIAKRYGARIELPAETDTLERPRHPARPVAGPDEARETARVSQLAFTLRSIPPALDFARIGSFDLVKLLGRPQHAKVEVLLEQDPHFVALIGADSGAGKSAAAVAMFRQWVAAAEWPAGYVVRASALTEAEDNKRLGGPTPELVRAKQTRLLVIDELGGEENVERNRAFMNDLVWDRFEKKGPRHRTIVTTPLDRPLLTERYGEGMARRLYDAREGDTAILTLRRKDGAK